MECRLVSISKGARGEKKCDQLKACGPTMQNLTLIVLPT